MNLKEWEKKKILILGFGREGQATYKFLHKNCAGVALTIADRRTWDEFSLEEKDILNQTGVKPLLGEEYLKNLEEFDLIVKSPGITPRLPEIQKAIKAGVEMSSATRIFFSLKKGQVVAVTGSKGKSTTASMIEAMLKAGGLKAQLIGNIGRAALDFLAEDVAEKIYVFEMSSYQLEDFEGGAEVAVLVSFFPEHLDYHGSLEAYFQAKMKLIGYPKPGQAIVYNAGNSTLETYLQDHQKELVTAGAKIMPFNDGKMSRVEEKNSELMAKDGDNTIVREKEIKLKGRHNLENILAVVEVAKLFHVSMETLQKALREFEPLEHRLELVGIHKDITFYNDAISTTPESTIAAIETLARIQPVSTLIAGGMDRGYQFSTLAEKIIEAGIKNLILLPETGEKIAEAVKAICKEKGHHPPLIIFASDLKVCVDRAFELSPAGSICLLSCASPSYNLFKNFEDRGKQFKEAVRKN